MVREEAHRGGGKKEMQGKRGKLGVGRCTGGFDFSIPGCPPDEEAVYEGLRRFLRA